MRGIPSLLTILVLVFGNGLALADEPRLELFVQTGHTQWVMGVAISGDGKYVVTGSYDKTAILWEAASGKKLQSFRGHRGFINSVAISADGKFVVSGSDDRTAILWEAASGKKLQALQGHKDAVRSVAISDDGKLVVTGSADTSRAGTTFCTGRSAAGST